MRIGLFGGSFDPIHLGHLIMAQDASEHLGLEKTLFIPARISPLKDAMPLASDEERASLIQLAIEGEPKFELRRYDLETDGPSYSISTVEKAKNEFPQAKLYWILGADQIALLAQWRRIEELCQSVEFIALSRNGKKLKDLQPPAQAVCHMAPTHAMQISSSEIRERIQSGDSVKYFLPQGVLDSINSRNLYF